MTASEAGVFAETATQFGRRFIAAWREEEKHMTRLCQEESAANEARKVVALQGSVEPSKRHRLAW